MLAAVSSLPDDDAPADTDDDLRRVLSRLLTAAPLTTEASQAVMAALLVVLSLNRVPAVAVLMWVTVLAAALVISVVARRRLRASDAQPAVTFATVRNTVITLGLAWGAGVAVIGPGLEFADVVLFAVVFSGVVASATTVLLPDPTSYYSFVGTLIGPLTFGILASGQSRSHLVTASFILVFAATMIVVYRRSHVELLRQIGVSQDLKRSEAEVRKERAFLDGLLASAPMGIVALDYDGKVLGVNPSFLSLFGFNPEEVIGVELGQLMAAQPGDVDDFREMMKHLLTRGGVTREVERFRKDGTVVPVRMIAAPVHGATGRASAFVMYDDLTEKRKAQQALEDAEARYRYLVESASDLVWEIDRAGRWTFLNAACEQIYGYPPDGMIGRAMWDSIHPDFKERDRAAFERVLEGSEIADLETVHLDSGGRETRLSFSVRPEVDATGRVTGASGTARDVSERAAAREALMTAMEEAERATRAKSAFLATMSHEIRSPMNAIIGMTDVLLETHLTAEQRRGAELVRTSAEDLLGTLNNILDLSKIEAEQLDIERISFDLPALIDKVVRLLAVKGAEKNVAVRHEVTGGVPRFVVGDPGRLRQVITNLVANAIKFTPEGSVTVSTDVTSGGVEFRIVDTGIGIPEGRLEAIFEEFSQADSSTTRKYGGTGLGLAISRGIVRLMGGDISVESSPGSGSCFSFVIPLPADESRTASAGQQGIAIDVSRILVVEGDPVAARVVIETLSAEGAEVTVAGHADEALEALGTASGADAAFDLAIINIQLPSGDGFEVASNLRGDARSEQLQIMVTTDTGVRGDSQRCVEAGIAAYLMKPISRVDLLEVVGAVLARGPFDPNNAELITRHSIAEARSTLDVLVVDDSRVNREIAAAHLTRRGHHVEFACDGQEAVDAVDGKRFDVVLMDIQMPGMDGREATTRIRSTPGSRNLTVVGLSAHAGDEERELCLAAGMSSYLAKPYSPRDLFAVVEGWGVAHSERPEAAEEHSPAAEIDEFRRQMREAGAEEAVPALLDVFWQEAPAMMQAVEDAFASGDCESLKRAAHKYKSSSGSVGASSLSQALSRLEATGKNGDISGAGETLESVRSLHDAFASLLSDDEGGKRG